MVKFSVRRFLCNINGRSLQCQRWSSSFHFSAIGMSKDRRLIEQEQTWFADVPQHECITDNKKKVDVLLWESSQQWHHWIFSYKSMFCHVFFLFLYSVLVCLSLCNFFFYISIIYDLLICQKGLNTQKE